MTRLEAVAAAKRRDAELKRQWHRECDAVSRAISGEPYTGVLWLQSFDDFKFERIE